MLRVDSRLARRGVIAAALLALAGCGASGGGSGSGTAPCPRIAILAEGSELTRYRPGAPRDLSQMAFDAKIVGFDARCDFASRDRNTLEVRVTPRFGAERGPAADGRVADLPWFVAVTDAGDSEVLERVPATTRVTFPANVGRAVATGTPLTLTLPIGGDRGARDYAVRISFQLSPDDLAHNRARGVR
jgi:hypothetical protein